MAEQERPGSLAEALIALQARLPRIPFNASIQFGNRTHKYADLASITDAVLPLLAELGLYWTCAPTLMDGTFVLDYVLTHESGGSIGGQYPLPNSTPQTIGGAITYARRYALCAVLGLAAEDDDDGQAAEADWHPPANPSSRKAQRSRGTAAETTDWTERPPDDDTPGTITDQQLLDIHKLWTATGIPAEDRQALIMSALHLEQHISRTRDLSRGQGENLIAYLRALETSTEGGA